MAAVSREYVVEIVVPGFFVSHFLRFFIRARFDVLEKTHTPGHFENAADLLHAAVVDLASGSDAYLAVVVAETFEDVFVVVVDPPPYRPLFGM